jgi:transposase
MSLHPKTIQPVPEETARVARAAFPKGNLCLILRDELGTLFSDEQFTDLFPTRGQPAQAPWRLALVSILQFVENLSDRQAAEALRSRIDWKYLLGLELTDPGFDASILCEFRARLLNGQAEARLFERLIDLFKERGWVKARGKQRTDSSHVLAAIRVLGRLEQVGETLRHALNLLAEAAPDWLLNHVPPDWFDRYARRFEEARLPSKKTEQQQMAVVIAQDGYALLRALYFEQAPTQLRHLGAVQILRQVWLQQFYRDEETIRWREEQEMPTAAERINSPFDTEARYSIKGDLTWTGYKIFLTETCDPEQPRLITQVSTSPATTQDMTLTAAIQADLNQKDLLPAQHLVDARFLDADLLVSSKQEYGIDLLGPIAKNGSWQAKAGQGFDATQFQIDWTARQATCPQGKHSRYWQPHHDSAGNPLIYIRFAASDCHPCPHRALCNRAKSGQRTISVRPQEQYEALQQARVRQRSPEFTAHYARRAGIECAIGQGIRDCGLRSSGYIGQAKTHLQNMLVATALNVIRITAWLRGIPIARTRRSAFARLKPQSVGLAVAVG